MSTCPDCRYCAPRDSRSATIRWPHPARWFDQPCMHCSHRLKAHDPGIPGALAATEAEDVVAAERVRTDGSACR